MHKAFESRERLVLGLCILTWYRYLSKMFELVC